MDFNSSRLRGAAVLALLGTSSFLTIAGTEAARAQGAPAASPTPAAPAVEEVLVTGSLIRGVAAVGVPVTALSDQDFKENGALTIADLLKSVPSVNVQLDNVVTNSGGTIEKGQKVQIHNLGTAKGTKTLMLVDGMRVPPQGHEASIVDPSIIPQLAVDHIDVLADGASAVYGSDAVAGVINVVLKHNFDGAVTQVRFARSSDLADPNFQATQLYGTKWDSGSATLTYEWYHEANVPGPGRDYYTLNFEPYGFEDQTPIGAATPGVVSTGALVTPAALAALGFSANVGTRACANCYSIPAGAGWNYGDTLAHTNPLTPGSAPTTSWAALQANPGVKNLRNVFLYADLLPNTEVNRGTAVFDQTVVNDIGGVVRNVSLFGEGYYSNRQSLWKQQPGSSPAQTELLRAQVVPTTNPYYPIGAPAGLRVSYDIGVEDGTRIDSQELEGRYAGGFDADLPDDWKAHTYFAKTLEQNHSYSENVPNVNNVSAALGNTVASTAASGIIPGVAAYTKPASVPYLNLFCDATEFQCNSPTTLAYIEGHRRFDERWLLGDAGLNFSGPLLELPGGMVQAAVGGNTVSNHYYFAETTNYNTANNAFATSNTYDAEEYSSWAAYSQLDIPLVGEGNNLPLIKRLNLEVIYRYDQYKQYGGVTTPNVAATWELGYGLTVRGAWTKSFRVPNFTEYSASAGVGVQPENVAAGDVTDTVVLNCKAVPNQPNSPTAANPGSLNAYLNPTCSSNPALASPGGLQIQGGAGGAAPIRGGSALSPEKAKNWSLGLNFAPTDVLAGVNVDVTWYHVHVDDVITTNNLGGVNENDPINTLCTTPRSGCEFYVRANPLLPITDPANAVFFQMVSAEISNPRAIANPAFATNIQYIRDDATANLGWSQVSGLDMSARYDFDLGDWGAWDVGATGNYQLENKQDSTPGKPATSGFVGNTGGRLIWRGRVGWTGTDGFSVTGFIDGVPHSTAPGSSIPPACYWAAGYSAGSCYPGSPYSGPRAQFSTAHQAMYLFDLSLGYQTGVKPANTYLQNLNFQFTVQNLFNTPPAFDVDFASSRGHAVWDDVSPLQRYVSFAVTKAW